MTTTSRCDLLEKSYLCGINNNIVLPSQHLYHVVICLKSLTFVVSITTYSISREERGCCDLLEKSYLCGINNNHAYSSLEDISCDLLEKSYLCGINNNGDRRLKRLRSVVICLKSLTFVVSITTNEFVPRGYSML